MQPIATNLAPEIIVADEPPFPVEVLIFEEDTNLILSAGNVVREIREDVSTLLQIAAEQVPLSPGDLVCRGSRWSAIVFDLDHPEQGLSPGATIIENLIGRILEQVDANSIQSIGIQPLGGHHTRRGAGDFVSLLQGLRDRGQLPACLKKVWVILN